jgi:sn-glycerol 3-phosphate transport system ATP-binding protein
LPLAGVEQSGVTLQADGEYVLGIRPEHIVCGERAAADAHACVSLEVEVCEVLGADNLAHGKWQGQSLVVRLPHHQRPDPGAVLQVLLPPAQMHFFDAHSGRRVA